MKTNESKNEGKRARKSPLRTFSNLLDKSAAMARHPLGRFLVQPLAAFYGHLTLRRKGAPAEPNSAREFAAGKIAHEFQGLFPSRRMYRITEVQDEAAHMEIRVECPLRGTGDGAACHRLMQYDRTMAARLGAEFHVLSSQAISGEATCSVAITRPGTPAPELPTEQ